MAFLEVKDINTYYGSVQALHNASIQIRDRDIVSIVGANGAGKSTLMKSIMGLARAKSGSIIYKNQDISKDKTDSIVKKGIVYVPEGREIFPDLSIQDNLEMGAYCRKFSHREMEALYQEMFELFPRLGERRKQLAGSLSGGEQQMLAIARGLMSRPELLMFDEPSLGLAPVIVDEVFDIIFKINKEKGIPVLLVEQNAYMAMLISQYCYVLENGCIKKHGSSRELMESDDVKKAYLGG